jgi:hypothetical protein
MAQVQGQVWLIETPGERPAGDLAIVSSVQFPHATQYRVVGTPPAHYLTQPIEPTLEDAYLSLFLK